MDEVLKTKIPRGEERFIFVNGDAKGCLWNGIYQVETTVFRLLNAVMLGADEWRQVRNCAKVIEMVSGDTLLRWIPIDRAYEQGWFADTKLGPRYAIPVRAWELPEAEGRYRHLPME